MNNGYSHKSRRKTPWDEMELRTPMQEFLYQPYKMHYDDHHPCLTQTGETDLINSYILQMCPHCSSETFKLNGHTQNGVQAGC